ncbi:hypothetical protein EG829_25000, partial [bacterium]|nr:hypothetical protein [bacterium]
NVNIEWSTNGSAWNLLAGGEANDGTYAWSVDPGAIPAASTYLIRVTSVDSPSVQDASDTVFAVAPSIGIYYVNIPGDANLTDNEYTTAAGDDANSGLTPDAPKASVLAVLNQYDLEPGDIILIDSGTYTLTGNISLVLQDSGVTVRGAQGHATILNRNNTNSGQYTIQLSGATDITVDHLTLTGGYYGVYAAAAANSDRYTISNSEITGNSNGGININSGTDDGIITSNEIHDNGGTFGVYLYSVLRGQVTGNHVYNSSGYGNTGTGIYTNITTTAADRVMISGNRVHDLTTGINTSNYAEVFGNTLWSNTTGINTGASGIVHDNVTFNNSTGITVSGASAYDNEVYGNRTYGIESYNSLVQANRIYNNPVGINDTGYSRIINNVVWNNTATGIRMAGNYTSSNFGTPGVFNNTILQASGNALRVD